MTEQCAYTTEACPTLTHARHGKYPMVKHTLANSWRQIQAPHLHHIGMQAFNDCL